MYGSVWTFFFKWEERIYGTRRFNAPAAGAQWKIYVYASMLFYRKIYLYHPSPSFTYYLSSLSVYILYHPLSTTYTMYVSSSFTYYLTPDRTESITLSHIMSYHFRSHQPFSNMQYHATTLQSLRHIQQSTSPKDVSYMFAILQNVVSLTLVCPLTIPHFGPSPHYPSLWSVRGPSLALPMSCPRCGRWCRARDFWRRHVEEHRFHDGCLATVLRFSAYFCPYLSCFLHVGAV